VKRFSLVVVAVLALVVAACAGGETESRRPSVGSQPRLVDLDSIFLLKRAFNDDRGHTRLVVFLSPT
jgi:hypothetical protein